MRVGDAEWSTGPQPLRRVARHGFQRCFRRATKFFEEQKPVDSSAGFLFVRFMKDFLLAPRVAMVQATAFRLELGRR
jgi:hypothetical protein